LKTVNTVIKLPLHKLVTMTNLVEHN